MPTVPLLHARVQAAASTASSASNSSGRGGGGGNTAPILGPSLFALQSVNATAAQPLVHHAQLQAQNGNSGRYPSSGVGNSASPFASRLTRMNSTLSMVGAAVLAGGAGDVPPHHAETGSYTRKELKEYRAVFSMFDTDGSGAIGSDELKQAMLSIGLSTNHVDIDQLIREVDADGNGEIDFSEFCACMKRGQLMGGVGGNGGSSSGGGGAGRGVNDEIVRLCFEVFDQDHNGLITPNEFKYVAIEVGGFSDELAERVFRELDVSAAGHLSIDQFAAIVEEYLLQEPSKTEWEALEKERGIREETAIAAENQRTIVEEESDNSNGDNGSSSNTILVRSQSSFKERRGSSKKQHNNFDPPTRAPPPPPPTPLV